MINKDNYTTLVPNEKGLILFDINKNHFFSTLNLSESIWKIVDEYNLEYNIIFPQIEYLPEHNFEVLLQGEIFTNYNVNTNLHAQMLVTGKDYVCHSCLLDVYEIK